MADTIEIHRRFDPYAQLLEAEAAVGAVTTATPALGVILHVIEAAKAAVEAAGEDPGFLKAASCRLDEVFAAITSVEGELDDQLIYGAGSLVALAKANVDARLIEQKADDAPRRREISRLAGCQIEALAEVLRDAGRGGSDVGVEDLVVAVAVRVRQLAGVVMSAAGDDGAAATAAEMEEVLYG